MFREKIQEHGERVETLLKDFPHIATIEAGTKTSLIEPFLQCLGYDTSHPKQVSLEVLTELGGRIDYLLTGRENVKIAVEAKKAGTTLSVKETNQLRSYFTFSEAVAGVLTNGVDVWLFTDLDKANVMDAEPYLKIDTRRVSNNDTLHLESLTRARVNKTAIHDQARREQSRKLVNQIVAYELHSPSQEFLKLIGKKAEITPLTKGNLEKLRPLVLGAISRLLTGTLSPDTPAGCQYETSSSNAPQDEPQTPHPHKGKSDSTTIGAGRKAALTKAAFLGATLFGKDLSVSSYKGMLIAVVKDLHERHSSNFAEIVQDEKVFLGRKWWAINKNRSNLSPSNPKTESNRVGEFYVDVHLSAEDKIRRAHQFLEAFGHDPKLLVIQTSD